MCAKQQMKISVGFLLARIFLHIIIQLMIIRSLYYIIPNEFNFLWLTRTIQVFLKKKNILSIHKFLWLQWFCTLKFWFIRRSVRPLHRLYIKCTHHVVSLKYNVVFLTIEHVVCYTIFVARIIKQKRNQIKCDNITLRY